MAQNENLSQTDMDVAPEEGASLWDQRYERGPMTLLSAATFEVPPNGAPASQVRLSRGAVVSIITLEKTGKIYLHQQGKPLKIGLEEAKEVTVQKT